MPKDDLESSQYYEKNNRLYIKTSDLVKIVFNDIDARTEGRPLKRITMKLNLIQNGLFLKDQMLFDEGIYLSPDLPLLRVLQLLMTVSGSGFVLCLVAMFIKSREEKRLSDSVIH